MWTAYPALESVKFVKPIKFSLQIRFFFFHATAPDKIRPSLNSHAQWGKNVADATADCE